MQATTTYNVRPSIGSRINFRMIVIIAVFAALVGVPVYSFVKNEINHGIEKVGNRFNVDLKTLGYFDFNNQTGTISSIPPQDRALDGKEVALEGFMFCGNQASDKVNGFQFVYNISKCCFGGPPKVQERVFAFVPNGAVDYSSDEVRIIGTLHVNVEKDDAGKVSSIYTMEVKQVEPM